MRRRTYKIELKNFRQIFTGSRFPNAAFKKTKKKSKVFQAFLFCFISVFFSCLCFFFSRERFHSLSSADSVNQDLRTFQFPFFFIIIIFLFLIIDKLIFRLLPLSFMGRGKPIQLIRILTWFSFSRESLSKSEQRKRNGREGGEVFKKMISFHLKKKKTCLLTKKYFLKNLKHLMWKEKDGAGRGRIDKKFFGDVRR